MATTAQRLLTAAEFGELPEPVDRQRELVRGEVVEMLMNKAPQVRTAWRIQQSLDPFVREHGFGVVYPDGAGYLIERSPDTVRGPDVSFIAQERIPAEDWPDFFPFVPDLAVEVVSPSDRTPAVLDKVGQYLNAGTRLVWVVWPKRQVVTVYMPDGEPRELGADDELDGDDVLPGFRMRVADLFAPRR